MSKLYNEPNTIKNGHLTQKLCSMKDIKFSKKCENELKHPHYCKRLLASGVAEGYSVRIRLIPGEFTGIVGTKSEKTVERIQVFSIGDDNKK